MKIDKRGISEKALQSTRIINVCFCLIVIVLLLVSFFQGSRDVAYVVPSPDSNDGGGIAFDTRLMEVTAYCPCVICCGEYADGITASGMPATGLFVAAGADIPFFTKVIVPGYANGLAVPVLDRGGAIKGDRLDVFFSDHQSALEWDGKH